MRTLGLLLLAVVTGCYSRDPAPRSPQLGPAGGYAPDDFDPGAACGSWSWSSSDYEASKHVSFPDDVPHGCFVQVHYDPDTDQLLGAGPIATGCGYPRAGSAQQLRERARRYRQVERGEVPRGEAIPLELACPLPDSVRRVTARANALTLERTADLIEHGTASFPYAVSGTFGFGSSDQNRSKLLSWEPGEPCVVLDDAQRRLLGVNVMRARRVADAHNAGLSPLITVSGGAVHGELIEAFMLGHLAICDGGVPPDRVLYDPCADHTHTNVRNTGAIIAGIGARTGYLVTDDFIQSDYMQDYVWFEAIGGSIDQRALRDWGHLIGSWRQASRGMDAGFWYTPFRFWSEPEAGLGSFTCARDAIP